MLGMSLDFLIGAVVAATLGFGGIITSSPGAGLAIALVCFCAIVALLLPGYLRALRGRRPRRSRRKSPDIPLIRIRGTRHDNRRARIGA
jgi:uncharacterized membrane protein YtjA (UPF0391 family)